VTPYNYDKPKLKEKDIQRQIKEWLEYNGWFVAVTSTPAMTAATKGLPDLIAVKDSIRRRRRTVWIEVKGPKGKQSEHQAAFQEALERQGAEYLLANDLDVVRDYLKEAK
jgi:Holliday junction resolvase